MCCSLYVVILDPSAFWGHEPSSIITYYGLVFIGKQSVSRIGKIRTVWKRQLLGLQSHALIRLQVHNLLCSWTQPASILPLLTQTHIYTRPHSTGSHDRNNSISGSCSQPLCLSLFSCVWWSWCCQLSNLLFVIAEQELQSWRTGIARSHLCGVNIKANNLLVCIEFCDIASFLFSFNEMKQTTAFSLFYISSLHIPPILHNFVLLLTMIQDQACAGNITADDETRHWYNNSSCTEDTQDKLWAFAYKLPPWHVSLLTFLNMFLIQLGQAF